jgi:broad specificity phosphatase PhoE
MVQVNVHATGTARTALRAFWICALLAVPAAAAAQQSIIIVRHAEREPGDGDVGISEAGRQRAERLAGILKDAGVTHIFVSDRRRTLETAQPLARALNISPSRIAIPARSGGKADPSELQVRATLIAISRLPRNAVVLVVGHSNTVPMFLTRLGYGPRIAIPDGEFDNLFVVTPRATRAPAVVRMRF